MHWLEPTVAVSIWQQIEFAPLALRPTNPSSLTLALIGIVSFLVYRTISGGALSGIRRRKTELSAQQEQPRPTNQPADQRRVA